MYNKIEHERRIKEGISCLKNSEKGEAKKRTFITKIINRFNPKGAILEVGCHFGAYSFLTCNKDRLSIGVDYVYEGLDIGRKYANKQKKDISFIQADAIQLPFLNRKINFIINIDFIEHIVYEKQTSILREMHRVLAPHSLILVYTPNLTRTHIEYLVNKIKYLLRGRHFGWQEDVPYKDKPELKNHQDTKLHVGLLSFNELKKLFIKNKFKIKKIYRVEYNPPFLTWFFKRFKIRFTPFYSIFCSNSLLLLEKI